MEVVPWDPMQDPTPDEAPKETPYTTAARRATPGRTANQRRNLNHIKERLQRAVMVGSQSKVDEREEDASAIEPFVPASTVVSLLSKPEEGLHITSLATAVLVTKQFESMARSDIMLEQRDELADIGHSFFVTAQWIQALDNKEAERRLNAQIEQYRARHMELQSSSALIVAELESASRARVEEVHRDCYLTIDKELSRAFEVIQFGQRGAQHNWLMTLEDRERHSVMLDCERSLARLFSLMLSESQAIIIHHKRAAAAKGNNEESAGEWVLRLGSNSPGATADSPTAYKPPSLKEQSVVSNASSPNIVQENIHRVKSMAAEGAAQPQGDQPYDAEERDGEAASEASGDLNVGAAAPDCFPTYWGYMYKSTGVHMSWNKRFFYLNKFGKCKVRTSTGKTNSWKTAFHAASILRVEHDSYNDSSHGIQPPVSQYHQYGFYVDIGDPVNPRKQERLRFCCASRGEMNGWMYVLREAADIVFSLEESGVIPRSPHHRLIDPELSDVIVSPQKYRNRVRQTEQLGSPNPAPHSQQKSVEGDSKPRRSGSAAQS